MKIIVYYANKKEISVDDKFEKVVEGEISDNEWAALANELWEEVDKECSKDNSAFCYCSSVETPEGEILMEL